MRLEAHLVLPFRSILPERWQWQCSLADFTLQPQDSAGGQSEYLMDCTRQPRLLCSGHGRDWICEFPMLLGKGSSHTVVDSELQNQVPSMPSSASGAMDVRHEEPRESRKRRAVVRAMLLRRLGIDSPDGEPGLRGRVPGPRAQRQLRARAGMAHTGRRPASAVHSGLGAAYALRGGATVVLADERSPAPLWAEESKSSGRSITGPRSDVQALVAQQRPSHRRHVFGHLVRSRIQVLAHR